MHLPTVSCQCVTYGRTDYAEEAIEFFLRQDYAGRRELIIVNDLPQQRLHFSHPLIRILNVDQRFPTLGDKRNYAVEQCRGDVVVCWDDDDGFLPSHLSACVSYLDACEYARPNRCFVWHGSSIERMAGSFIAQHVFRKEAFYRVGGYRAMNSGQDMALDNALRRSCHCRWPELRPEQVTYLFRWGNGSYHLSGFGRDRAGVKSGYQIISERVEQGIRAGTIETGDLYLTPHFRHDYVAIARRFAESLSGGKVASTAGEA